MKKVIFALIFTFFALYGRAQETSSTYNFLKLPVSAHAAALGGDNISLIEDDASLIFGNPALLTSVSDKTLNLNFMTYMEGSKAGSAAFVKAMGERSTLGFTGQFVDYGSLDETTVNNEVTGTFSARDMAIAGLYSYNLSDLWVGGVTAKGVYSKYGDYSSFALAVDLGINYFNEDADFSLSAVARNLGGQIKKFDNEYEKLPFDLQAGFTKGISHAPIRVSLTLIDLTRWKKSYYYSADGDISTGKMLMNHIAFGVDIVPADIFYISAGYNFRRGNELKSAGAGHGAGWSFGAGLTLTRFKLGIAYAKYHVGSSSLLFNASYSL
jgi:long-subunit fatty acid transport protein